MKNIEQLYQLRNKSFVKIGLFENTLWLCFGDEMPVFSEFGILTMTYPYTLYINCSWRLSKRKEIVFAKQDLNYENSYPNSRVSEINEKQKENILVEALEINELSDVIIVLSEDIRIDLFLDTSIHEEQIKLFNQNTKNTAGSEQNKDLDQGLKLFPAAEAFEKNLKEKLGHFDLLISHVFDSSAYGLFRDFCKRECLIYISDITEEVLFNFSRIQGIGSKRYLDVLNKLEKLGYFEVKNSELIKSATGSIYKNILISQVFSDREYELFSEFCKSENLIYVGDIKNDYLKKFRFTKGVSQKRYLDTLNRLEVFADELKLLEESCFTAGKIFEYAKKIKLSEILSLLRPKNILYSDANLFVLKENLPSEIKDFLYDQNVKLFELEKKPFKELGHISEIENLVIISNELSKIQTPKDVLLEYKSKHNKNQQLVLKMRIFEEKTLEEVGQALSLTRERIRQIESQIRQQIKGLFRVRLNDLLILIAEEENYITSRELADILGEENEDAIKVLKLNGAPRTPLHYSHEFDIYFFRELDKFEFQERVDLFLSELPEIFRFSDYKNLFEEIFPLSNEFSFESIYDEYGFNKYGEFYSSRKLNPVDILNLICKHYVVGSIKLDEDGIKKISELGQTYFGVGITGDARAIDARARDSEQLLLVDKLTYQWFDPKTINEKLLSDILDYLNHEFKKREFVNSEQVFSKFKDQLSEHQILNKRHLYSIIKYFLDDQLVIGKGNTLNIYPDENNKMSVEEKVVALIEEEGGLSTKAKIQQTTHWSMFRIDQIISQSSQIIVLEQDGVRLFKTLQLTDEIKNELLEIISTCMSNGFTTSAIILRTIAKIPHVNDFMTNNEISTSKTIASIIKIIHPQIKGHTMFLHYDYNPEKTFEEALIRMISERIERKSLLRQIQEYGYSEAMSAVMISKMVEKKMLIKIDRGVYLPAYKFDISIDVLEKLEEFIESQFRDSEFFSLDSLDNFELYLPDIEYEWTASLMEYVLTERGYRTIRKYKGDYRYDKIILLKKGSMIKSFDELIYMILCDYEGDFHEQEVFRYLIDSDVIREIRVGNTYSLLSYIKNDPQILRIDEYGVVHLESR